MASVTREDEFPEPELRPMHELDVPVVVTIERSSYQFPWSEGIFRDCLRVGYVCRVVEVGSDIAGYGIMSMGAGEAHILNVCVREEYRCRGLARKVLLYLIDRARNAGMYEAYLEVRPSNTIAAPIRSASGAAIINPPWDAKMRPYCAERCFRKRSERRRYLSIPRATWSTGTASIDSSHHAHAQYRTATRGEMAGGDSAVGVVRAAVRAARSGESHPCPATNRNIALGSERCVDDRGRHALRRESCAADDPCSGHFTNRPAGCSATRCGRDRSSWLRRMYLHRIRDSVAPTAAQLLAADHSVVRSLVGGDRQQRLAERNALFGGLDLQR